MPRRKNATETSASETPEQNQPPADDAGIAGDRVELDVHIDFEIDGRGVHIAPGVVLAHKIPAAFLSELIERQKARLLR